MSQQRVLVTGGSGFIAGHTILQLLDQGYLVRTTVRSLDREPAVRKTLADAGATNLENLTFTAADLTHDDGWAAAADGSDFVLHVASPVHPGHVENEDDLIVPAREGTLRVLRAARDAGVRRVVLTSAFHAVGFGHPHTDHVFTEDDWTVLDGPGVDAYGKSKTLAERAAWAFMTDQDFELTTLLPVAVMGTALGDQVSGSNGILRQMLSGELAGFPNLYIPIVDVRDVATAHVTAMTAPGAAGQRILVASGAPAVAMSQIGSILRSHLGEAAAKVPTETVPDALIREAARSNPDLRWIAADLGFVKQISTAKADDLLGLTPRTPEQAVLAGAESLIAKSLV